jgi:hypothetical protein
MKRTIIYTAVVLVLVAGAIGAYFYFKQTPDIVQDKPDAVVSAKALIAAFDADTAAASKQYIDKIVEVSGMVKSIDTAAVVLGEEGSPSEVVVGLDRRHLGDVQQLKVGAVGVMQGICSGYDKSSSADPDDLLASLGTTIHLRSAGVKLK